ncbi:MAG: 8-oxo-dGTP diphosphatase [Candidatus Marsarchaeota archaeon]|nr:8-oxo-dGTP diphosphatase [Candidatus Marsarchaeota archaeon]
MALLDGYRGKFKLRQVSLCLLVREMEVLLALKKRSFGVGKWNGVGGKQQPGESIEQTAVRETQEEIGVTPTSMRRVATLNFYFVGDTEDRNWNQQVVVFLVNKWDGTPAESEEMRPEWFKQNELPFQKMWEDDAYWMPQVLEGKNIIGHFLFDENQKMVDREVEESASAGI